MPVTAAIALGGNIGNVPETFSKALAALAAEPGIRLLNVSRNYSTRPIGENAGEPFINAVALLDVDCPPELLLLRLQQLETEFGRVRTVHWGPRTLDLDILSYGDVIVNFHGDAASGGEGTAGSTLDSIPSMLDSRPSTLFIPHPACWYRRFVLDPWCDVAPRWRHPRLGETVQELRGRLLARPLGVGITGPEIAAGRMADELRLHFALEEMAIVVHDPSCHPPEMILSLDVLTPESGARTILLPSGSAGLSGAVQILRAALDEPVLLSD
jgi:2-amino-4-hydroxy-6-hydroxymethyldihydropteridine diphosphokinase